MATYYVRPGGTGNGTGQALNQAWGTIAQALAASGGITSGDTLYIAPGNYNEQLTVNFTSPTAPTYIIGDSTASQFTGLTPGYVRITAYPANQASAATFSGVLFSATSKNYLNISNIHFEGTSSTSLVDVLTSRYTNINKCSFINHDGSSSRCLTLSKTNATTTPIDATLSSCTFLTMKGTTNRCVLIDGTASANMSFNVTFNDCLMLSAGTGTWINGSSSDWNGGISFYNCTIIAGVTAIYNANGGASSTYPHIVKNCILHAPTGVNNAAGVTSYYQITYSRILAAANIAISTSGTGTSTAGALGLETGYALINALPTSPIFASVISSPNQNFGNITSSPVVDIYNVPWSGSAPDAGSGTYFNTSSITTYNPTERNASLVTIAPGATSQSVELYLGATGLTASTSGLSARYNRTRTASVSIPLVARTIGQAWTAGGFAEVDATNMPGVYRLDLPDAALAAGADDVTVVVRGASGTNGAVISIRLATSGLTSAQTASAVWGALTDDHTTHGTYGWNVLRADADSKEGLVTLHQSGGISRVDADVHAIVNDTDAAIELKGALLHNGTDYISAELLTPVSAATSVHMGPYQLLADGLGADQPLDVNVGTATDIDVQVVDANGTGIDITGATVTAKVYNSGGTLVATYSGTATYADNGRLYFGLTTTVTNTSGTYTVTVTRTTGATDIQVFGPLRLYVRPV